MTAARCRWHLDSGRCPGTIAAPGAPEVPELCATHLATMIEPWARTRAQGSTADQWIDHYRRLAADTEHLGRAVGLEPPLFRRPRQETPDGK